MLNGAYLHVQYADDIRDEADERCSILGCFSRGNMLRILGQQPILLKRLALLGSLCVPDEVSIQTIRISIKENDHLIADLDVSHLLNEPDALPLPNGERLNPRMFSFELKLDGLTLQEPTVFAVSAFVNDFEVKGTRFFITNE